MLLTFGVSQLSDGCLEITNLQDQMSAQVTTSLLLPVAHACPSPRRSPPPLSVIRLTAAGEAERVQSHLLFYRQLAFSPRDLIISRAVKGIVHEPLSRTTIHTRTNTHALKLDAFRQKNLAISFLWWKLAQLYIHKDKQSHVEDGAENICKKKNKKKNQLNIRGL